MRIIAISIHALHEESDNQSVDNAKRVMVFQSTLSMRRATNTIRHVGLVQLISIHALHEESDLISIISSYLSEISIHALHEESDSPH